MSQYDHPQYSTAVYSDVGMSPWMSKHGTTPAPDTSYGGYSVERSVSRTSLRSTSSSDPDTNSSDQTQVRLATTTTGHYNQIPETVANVPAQVLVSYNLDTGVGLYHGHGHYQQHDTGPGPDTEEVD